MSGDPFLFSLDSLEGAIPSAIKPEGLENFFHLSLDLLCIADLNGNFLLVNPEWESVLGYSVKELNGKKFLDLVHPEDMQATLGAMKDLSEAQEVTGFENRFRAKDGSYRWIQWRSKAKGDLIYAVARDITQSKSQLAELERLSNLFKQTNEVARVGGWEVDLERGTLWWSDVTREIHECARDFVPNLEEGIDFYLEGEDRETIRREFSKAASEGIPFDLELRIVTAKRRVCWIRTVGKPIFKEGRVIRVVGAFQDIDDRKQAFAKLEAEEATLRGLFDLADVGIAMNDMETGAFMMFNDKLIEPTGYTREEFLALSYWQVTPEEYAEQERCALNQLREIGRYASFEKEYIRKDGSRYPVRLSGFKLQTTDRRDVIWSIIQDISAEKATEQELRDSVFKAEEANRAKSTFLATMSHEIRTPLNGVIGGTELIRTTQLSEEQRSCVEMILHSGDLLLSTINDVLDYSKIESGRIDLDNTSFDVIDLVEGLIDAVTPSVRQKRIDLVFFPAKNLPRRLIGDAVRLRQVLLNLVSNAIKFTDKGHIKIAISVEEDRQIRFQVKDTGIGIPADRIAEIFLPFVQVKSSTTRQFGGTGLGLSISHRLVALMGGELDVESAMGCGTCFYFQLPLEVESNENTSQKWSADATLEGKRVLILEGTGINQILLAHTFKAANADVTLVADWQNFLNTDFNAAYFDLIILDRNLGNEDTSSLLNRIQAWRGRSAKILMLASDTTGIPASLCDGIQQKPIKASQLLAQCRRMLGIECNSAAHMSKVGKATTDLPGSNLRVLLVEDNHLNQMIVRMILKRLGIEKIRIANNGEEAVAAWLDFCPDIILMDCQMPKLDGYGATMAIRAKESKPGTTCRVPIVGLSAAAIQGDREKALLAGMDDYLTKPLRPEELRSILSKFYPAIPGRHSTVLDRG